MNDEAKWVCIMGATILSVMFIAVAFEHYADQKTKQVEIQLKIEMIKAGITNAPTVK